MKKALILGTNAGQADIINYLNDTGWEVHSCGHKKEGPGCDLAHQFHLINTIDAEAVKNLAEEIKADIVYSVSSDSAIRTVTKVSEELGLPVLLNSDIIDLFHFKDRLRKFLNDNNINTVGFRKLSSIEELEGWSIIPCVVKPSDSQGQRGVQFIDNQKDLFEAVKLALNQSTSGTAIIEEYLEGIEISTNMIVQNGNVIVNEFTERLVFGRKYFGLPKGHSIPIRNVTPEMINEAGKIAVKLVEKLNITDAVLYIQMKVTEKGPKIIEVAPRLDGCHIWRLIKFAKAYDLRQYAIDCLTKTLILHKDNKNNDQYTLAFHHLKTASKFSFDEIKLPEDVVYNEYRYNPGEIVQPINGTLEVVGYFIKKDIF
jgi:phosphoribosylamine-glycine ligase